MAMTESVRYEQNGGVVTLTLNEPDTRNALSPANVDALVAHCARINIDMSARCAIVAGADESFSSGGNVKESETAPAFSVDQGAMWRSRGPGGCRLSPSSRRDGIYPGTSPAFCHPPAVGMARRMGCRNLLAGKTRPHDLRRRRRGVLAVDCRSEKRGELDLN